MSPTKVGPANQHEVLHAHYGHYDCCLCRLELKVEQFRKQLERELDRATEAWAEAENDSREAGYFDALRDVQHQLRLHGLYLPEPATAVREQEKEQG